MEKKQGLTYGGKKRAAERTRKGIVPVEEEGKVLPVAFRNSRREKKKGNDRLGDTLKEPRGEMGGGKSILVEEEKKERGITPATKERRKRVRTSSNTKKKSHS